LTALHFTRQAARVQAMWLADVDALEAAATWMADRGAFAWIDGRILRAADGHEGALIARVGQWLTWDPATGFFDVVDGDDVAPIGHVGGLGVVEQ
jgi:hypothetical protein